MSLSGSALAHVHSPGSSPSAAMVGAALKRSRVKGRAGVDQREAVLSQGCEADHQGLCREWPPAEMGASASFGNLRPEVGACIGASECHCPGFGPRRGFGLPPGLMLMGKPRASQPHQQALVLCCPREELQEASSEVASTAEAASS